VAAIIVILRWVDERLVISPGDNELFRQQTVVPLRNAGFAVLGLAVASPFVVWRFRRSVTVCVFAGAAIVAATLVIISTAQARVDSARDLVPQLQAEIATLVVPPHWRRQPDALRLEYPTAVLALWTSKTTTTDQLCSELEAAVRAWPGTTDIRFDRAPYRVACVALGHRGDHYVHASVVEGDLTNVGPYESFSPIPKGPRPLIGLQLRVHLPGRT
jgi:hypothetical protein